MERRGADNSLAERILTARARVVVLRGPAASGKTTAVLEIYRRYLDAAGRPRCLLIVPNASAARALRRRLIDLADAGVVVSPAVVTFAGLAGRILAAAGEPARPIGPLQRRLLLSGIIAELHAAGELAALGAVADTPGLVVAVDRAIAELKRAAAEPQDVARAVARRAGKHGDLVEIYRRYQQHLRDDRAHDVEGQMWLAREHLRSAAAAGDDSPLPGVAGVSAVAADGFTDFTPTQLEILALLAGRLDRVVVTLPRGPDGRERMWRWADRTLASVRGHFGGELAEIDAGEAPAAHAVGDQSLRGLWAGVFDIDARAEAPAGLSVLAAAGIDAEVAAVARRVKRLLLDGAPAGSIAVLARSLEAYRECVERVFAAHDIGVAPAPEPLTDVPIVRFVLDVAGAAGELAWGDVLRIIRSSYFRPQALGAYDAATVPAAETLIRAGNVLSGRRAYAEAAERLAARAERDCAEPDDPDDESDAPSPHRPGSEAIRQAGEMLAGLFDLAERAADPPGLLALVEALGLRRAACEHGQADLIARDLRALAALGDHLGGLAEPWPPAAHLRDALAAVTCPAARGESLVAVLDVLDARALRFDHVFLLGASERQFPPRFVEGSLIGEADRAAWGAAGVLLDTRSDLTAREMLLFYLAVSRAETTLTVSYLETDASGRAGSPSSFLLSLLEPLGGLAAMPVVRVEAGQVVPPAAELAGEADAFNAAVAGLFGAGDGTGEAGGPIAWAVRERRQRLRRACMGIWSQHRRWAADEPSAFDGRITDPRLLATLRKRYPGQTVFSANRLNAYGQCPWQFFGSYVLGLAPLVEPARRLEPQTRGTFCHNVLCRLMRRLADRAGGPARLDETPEADLADALEAALAAEAAFVEARRPPYPVLWRIQLDRMRRELSDYLAAARAGSDLHAEGLHFELAFGQDLGDDEPHDPASRAEPVQVRTPAGLITLRGRIDRIDRVRLDDVEGLLVVDYKTGRLPSARDLAAGRNVQMPLYAAAAEAVLGEPCLGGTFHKIGPTKGPGERMFAGISVRAGRYRPDNGYESRLGEAMATIGQFIEGMAAGHFDVLAAQDCPSWCPFRRICHYSPARAARQADRADGEAG